MGALRSLATPTLVTVVFALLPASSAHLFSPLGPEAEDRIRDAGLCSPERESVRALPFSGASGDEVLELPDDGCWAEFDVILAAAAPLSIKLQPPAGPGEEARVLVRAVQPPGRGPPLAWEGATEARGGDGLVCARSNVILPPGAFTIRLTSQVTAGPDWANQHLDYVSVTGTCV